MILGLSDNWMWKLLDKESFKSTSTVTETVIIDEPVESAPEKDIKVSSTDETSKTSLATGKASHTLDIIDCVD